MDEKKKLKVTKEEGEEEGVGTELYRSAVTK